jgi:hypothetical protein
LKGGLIIGNDLGANEREVSLAQKFGYGGAGEVDAIAAGAGIADRDDGCS